MFDTTTEINFNSYDDGSNVTATSDTIGSSSSSINITDLLPNNVYEYYDAFPSTAPMNGCWFTKYRWILHHRDRVVLPNLA